MLNSFAHACEICYFLAPAPKPECINEPTFDDSPPIEAYADNLPANGDKPPSQATILIALAKSWDKFHDVDGTGYARRTDGTKKTVLPIRAAGFRQWLSGAFYKQQKKGCGGKGVTDAICTIEAQAINDGPCEAVFTRVAKTEHLIYSDLADAGHWSIEVSANDWPRLHP